MLGSGYLFWFSLIPQLSWQLTGAEVTSSSSSIEGLFFVIWFHFFFFQYSLTNHNHSMDFLFTHWQCHIFLRPIEGWDVSGMTSMDTLFYDKWNCNPDIRNWDVSNVIDFVSQSIASMHVTFYLFISKVTKQSLTSSSVCPISSLLLLSSTKIRHHSSCFHREICFSGRGLSTKTFPDGNLAAVKSIL